MAERRIPDHPEGRAAILVALVFGMLMAFGPFTIDLYLPAFPAVARDLRTTENWVQLTLTATTLGFGLGQVIIGPLSDAFGRRRPLLFATLLHFAASVAIIFAPSIGWVMAGRVAQGIGAAGSGVLALAMARDLFEGQRLVRMMTRIALVRSLAPIVAPVIGAQLLAVVSWRGLFAVLAVFGMTMTVVVSRIIGETLPPERRSGRSPRDVAGRYARLFQDRFFIGVMAVGGLSFSTTFIYLSWSSFVYQVDFGFSTQTFGLLFAVNAVGLMICAQISGRIMRRFRPRHAMTLWLGLMMSGAVGLWLSQAVAAPVWLQLLCLFVVIASGGGIGPAVQVAALSNHGAQAGTAAAMLGVFNFAVGGTIAPIVGLFGASAATMAGGMIVVIGSALLVLNFLVRPFDDGPQLR